MTEATGGRRILSQEELEALVKETDLGGREAKGVAGRLIAGICIAWSLFQLWYASPLPFMTGILVLNDTEARAIHIAFALFLAFTAYPALKSSPRDYVPSSDWVLAAAAAFAGSYLFTFYVALSTRPGQPTMVDLVTAGAGILLLLEATRRSLGWPMVFVAGLFIAFTFGGQSLPEVIQHKGASLEKFLQHQWLTTEGVYGVALGVSTGFVFMFVLFGSALDKAGGGNYMMQMSIALLGRLRGGPAKVAVVSSALNGVISGSSVSNVVSGGIFTIPMMKRTGLSGVKAGAIEAAASINGQLVPPVMGAAAFLMVEYVGIPYSQVITHAALPALIAYLSLLYIVHIEALKIHAKPMLGPSALSRRQQWLRTLLGWSGTILAVVIIYYGVIGLQALFGDGAGPVILILGLLLYAALAAYSAQYPDLEPDLGYGSELNIPGGWEVARTGLHFLIPIGVLLWCLMVDQLSPGLSAFYGTVTIFGILLTQHILFAVFRRAPLKPAALRGLHDAIQSLEAGARNMIGIAVATATAGIVVGTITLTGLGLMMTEFVEYLSGGNVIIMLILTALICLVLGCGIPTTANYILVATLMAPVIVELGAQSGLAIPLIAVHLFVFYFGIMADITPPVGLASYAAAAISGEDPIKTGLQGSVYNFRTAILPFVFIFNPQILLIGVTSWFEMLIVIVTSLLACLIFAAVTMNFFLTRSRIWETAVLALVCFTFFRPGFWMDRIYPPTEARSPAELMRIVDETPVGSRVTLMIEGTTIEGRDISKTVSLPLDTSGAPEKRLRDVGLTLFQSGDQYQIAAVGFGSYAARQRLEQGQTVVSVSVPTDRPSKHWMHIPAFLLLMLVWFSQSRRMERNVSLSAQSAARAG
jgi:TRAP transporter 4TM/12TM fusion protein